MWENNKTEKNTLINICLKVKYFSQSKELNGMEKGGDDGDYHSQQVNP